MIGIDRKAGSAFILRVAQPQLLGRHLHAKKIDAGRVGAGPGEAGDKTELHRVFADSLQRPF